MKIGFIGLGKMGGKMVQRLLNDGHQVVVYNLTQPEVDEAVAAGAIAASDLKDLVSKLEGEKLVWLMVPSGRPVDINLDALSELLQEGDIIVDGGNSYWAILLLVEKSSRQRVFSILDCGVPAVACGVWQNGYCLMYGGPKEACDFAEPIFKSLAPENGYIYCGESGCRPHDQDGA